MLDEMTAALPADLTERVLEVVGRQRGGDRSVIFISHRLIEIAAVCDRATVLREGETVGVVDVTEGSEERIVELMLGGRSPTTSRPAWSKRARGDARASDAQPRALCSRARPGTKLHDVSFELYPGRGARASSPSRARARTSSSTSWRARSARAAASCSSTARPSRSAIPRMRSGPGSCTSPADRAEALLMQRSVRENIALPFTTRLRRWGLIDLGDEKTKVDGADRPRCRSTRGRRARCAGSPAATSRR